MKFKRKRNKTLRNDFVEIAETIVSHPQYLSMKQIGHHSTSVYSHSVSVAYYSYVIADQLGLDKVSTARGALLHDFYLYKFSENRKTRWVLLDALRHMIDHPRIALKNAEKIFKLNNMERNIIAAHMFPAGLPRSMEAWGVSMVDKTLAIYEYALNFSKVRGERYEQRFSVAEES